MATCVSVALPAETATPPPMASPPFEAAKSWAICLRVAASTPEAAAARATSTPCTAAPSVFVSAPGACSPASRTTFSIASARRASVPGALRTH